MGTVTWTCNVAAPAATLTTGKAAENYLLEKQVGGLSPHSLSSYRNVLSDFSGFTGEIPAARVSTPLLKGYFASIFERDYKASTIQLYHSVISDFSRWLAETGVVSSNPMKGIIRPRTRRKLPRVLTEAESRRLILACGRDFNGARLRAMIMMFLGTGIRVSELAGLTEPALDLDALTIRVTGKGDKQRVIPISPTLEVELRSWLVTRAQYLEHQGIESVSLFVNQRGTCPHRVSIERQLKRLCARAGVTPISPHVLRHTFATNQAAAGKSLWELQQVLGHTDISTTQIYVKVSAQQIREGFGDPLRLFTS